LTDRRLNEAIVESGSRCPDDAELLQNHERLAHPDLQGVA
jgi:hypothetical protein